MFIYDLNWNVKALQNAKGMTYCKRSLSLLYFITSKDKQTKPHVHWLLIASLVSLTRAQSVSPFRPDFSLYVRL